jgi:hypothetical protein
MKDKSQLQAGPESVEHGNAVGVKTERERAYLAAVGKLYSNFESAPQRTRLIAYRDAMGEVAAKYPQDHEAQIFYALAIAASEAYRITEGLPVTQPRLAQTIGPLIGRATPVRHARKRGVGCDAIFWIGSHPAARVPSGLRSPC